ncbi:helix-turn-helix transcriptional regulator [Vagococcus coleopterorum]|uniref:Helix-turn-helix transcriptional regulator n=1 Tax=Vagococcus coleopterorum TaxID=2714946 RepID=A0A6G8ANN2_9ENTE|nr:helix-turn-helix transcriptional regulator [Vagococcus coleopterorum]QIL46579.1 helix-turn-helix transcriptional regulator [Vagococcus coleopterorum]
MSITETIKDIRSTKGWDIQTFSREILVSQKTITDWENNIGYPTHGQLLRIAKATGIPADELLASDHEYSEQLMADKKKLQWQGIIFTLMLMSGVILLGSAIFGFLATGEIFWIPAAIGAFLLADGSLLAKKYFERK